MPKSKLILKIASERIERLFELATEAEKRGNTKLSMRYIKIAMDISKHYQLTIPPRLKRRVCKKCGKIQIPGLNCRTTVASSKHYVIYTCECGAENKLFYKKAT